MAGFLILTTSSDLLLRARSGMHRKCHPRAEPFSNSRLYERPRNLSHNLGGLPQRSHADFETCRWDQIAKARGVNRPSPRPSPQPSPRPEFGYYSEQDLQPQQQNPYERPAFPPSPHQEPQIYGQPPQWQPDFQAPQAGLYPPLGVYSPQPPAYGYGQASPYGYDPNAPPPGHYYGGGPF